MPALQKKPRNVQLLLYRHLPNKIKDILGGPDNVDMTSDIMKQAGLTEEFRPYINTVVFGLFVGELNPRLLPQAIKEWLAVDDAKAYEVAGLVKKVFVDPHIDFLSALYKEKLTSSPPASNIPPVPGENVVNLKPKLQNPNVNSNPNV